MNAYSFKVICQFVPEKINDCTYTETIKNASRAKWHSCCESRSQTREIIYKLSTLELLLVVLMYSLGDIHTTVSLKYLKWSRI